MTRRSSVAVIVILVFVGLCSIVYAQAQSGTAAEIVFGNDLEEQAREQLRRILSQYKLDPWIVTHEIKIEAGAEPHSMPMLTLNTDFLDDDIIQMSIFLHEQAHWIVAQAEGRRRSRRCARSIPIHLAPPSGTTSTCSWRGSSWTRWSS